MSPEEGTEIYPDLFGQAMTAAQEPGESLTQRLAPSLTLGWSP